MLYLQYWYLPKHIKLTSCKMTSSNTPQYLTRSESRVLSIWLSTIKLLEITKDDISYPVIFLSPQSWMIQLWKTFFVEYSNIWNWKRYIKACKTNYLVLLSLYRISCSNCETLIITIWFWHIEANYHINSSNFKQGKFLRNVKTVTIWIPHQILSYNSFMKLYSSHLIYHDISIEVLL